MEVVHVEDAGTRGQALAVLAAVSAALRSEASVPEPISHACTRPSAVIVRRLVWPYQSPTQTEASLAPAVLAAAGLGVAFNAKPALREVAARHPSGRVLVVAHGTVIRNVLDRFMVEDAPGVKNLAKIAAFVEAARRA